MGALTLKSGKFYRDGELVPLEFGNLEQIKIINEQKAIIEAMNGDGLEIDVYAEEITHYELKTSFECIECKKMVYVEREIDDEDDKDEILGDYSCRTCRTKYTITKNKDGDFFVKKKTQ